MASIYKRKLKGGKNFTWRAVVRIKGYPVVCETFERKQEAEDWGTRVERQIKAGKFKFDQHKQQYTYNELVERFIRDGALEHHRSAKDTLRQLDYWKKQLGGYSLVHLSTDKIGKERLLLIESPSMRGKPRSMATVNRYMASLSATLTYAARQLRWINENPCLNLKKLKENPGRNRVLAEEEISRLLASARQSKSPYLYCIILISLTTGARQGEILNLEWRHVDFDNKIAYIKESKNGRPRSIALCDPVIEELRQLYQNAIPSNPLSLQAKPPLGRSTSKRPGNRLLKGRISLTAVRTTCDILFAPMRQPKEPPTSNSKQLRDIAPSICSSTTPIWM